MADKTDAKFDSIQGALGEILTKLARMEVKQDHYDQFIVHSGVRIQELEKKLHGLELENVKLKGFKEQIETLNENMEGLTDQVQRSMKRSYRNSLFVDGGTKLTWVVVSACVSGAIVALVAYFMYGGPV